MTGTKRKIVAEKGTCDLCNRHDPPIHEYEYRASSHVSHWVDLCDRCGGVDREVRGGFLAGIHFPANAPAKACKNAVERTQATGRRSGRPRAKRSA
jgi:hypothetical protein